MPLTFLTADNEAIFLTADLISTVQDILSISYIHSTNFGKYWVFYNKQHNYAGNEGRLGKQIGFKACASNEFNRMEHQLKIVGVWLRCR